MSDSDDNVPVPSKKPQPKPRSRRLASRINSSDSASSLLASGVASPTAGITNKSISNHNSGDALHNDSSSPASPPPRSRRKVEDDFFSKARNYRDFVKLQETALIKEAEPELELERKKEAAIELILTPNATVEIDLPVFDYEDEAKSNDTPVETLDKGPELKRKREISLTPPPELPVLQPLPLPSNTINVTSSVSIADNSSDLIMLDDEVDTPEELDPELLSIAAKVSQQHHLQQQQQSQQSTSGGLSFSPSISPSSSQFASPQPGSLPVPESDSIPSHSGSGAADNKLAEVIGTIKSVIGSILGQGSPTTTTAPGPETDGAAATHASQEVDPATIQKIQILIRMIRHPLRVVIAEDEPLYREVERPVKVTVRTDKPFKPMMQWYCEQKHLPFDQSQFVFTYRGSRLMPSSTPQSLEFPPTSVVDVYEASAYKYIKNKETLERNQRIEQLEKQAAEEATAAAEAEAKQKREQEKAIQKENRKEVGDEEEEEDGPEEEEEEEDTDGRGYLFIKLRGDRTADEKLRVKKTTRIQAILSHYRRVKGIPAESTTKLEFDDEALDPELTIGDTEIEDDDMLLVRVG
ncbi:hypothetical protein BGW38_005115, partial [Lunasporangiospora selenospora]